MFFKSSHLARELKFLFLVIRNNLEELGVKRLDSSRLDNLSRNLTNTPVARLSTTSSHGLVTIFHVLE